MTGLTSLKSIAFVSGWKSLTTIQRQCPIVSFLLKIFQLKNIDYFNMTTFQSVFLTHHPGSSFRTWIRFRTIQHLILIQIRQKPMGNFKTQSNTYFNEMKLVLISTKLRNNTEPCVFEDAPHVSAILNVMSPKSNIIILFLTFYKK